MFVKLGKCVLERKMSADIFFFCTQHDALWKEKPELTKPVDCNCNNNHDCMNS